MINPTYHISDNHIFPYNEIILITKNVPVKGKHQVDFKDIPSLIVNSLPCIKKLYFEDERVIIPFDNIKCASRNAQLLTLYLKKGISWMNSRENIINDFWETFEEYAQNINGLEFV